MALQAGLHPDWKRLLQGRGLTTERRHWPLTFSEGLRPGRKVRKEDMKNVTLRKRDVFSHF